MYRGHEEGEGGERRRGDGKAGGEMNRREFLRNSAIVVGSLVLPKWLRESGVEERSPPPVFARSIDDELFDSILRTETWPSQDHDESWALQAYGPNYDYVVMRIYFREAGAAEWSLSREYKRGVWG